MGAIKWPSFPWTQLASNGLRQDGTGSPRLGRRSALSYRFVASYMRVALFFDLEAGLAGFSGGRLKHDSDLGIRDDRLLGLALQCAVA